MRILKMITLKTKESYSIEIFFFQAKFISHDEGFPSSKH